MIDLKRLDTLHAATTQGQWDYNRWRVCANVNESDRLPISVVCDTENNSYSRTPENAANAAWIAEHHNAWPAVSARLALLEEFATRIKRADKGPRCVDETCDAIDWLDAETKKAGG